MVDDEDDKAEQDLSNDIMRFQMSSIPRPRVPYETPAARQIDK